ncbi:GNAT family N-acetyltransferase [Endozoicomonas sp. GU-1]|uniref:GNAT family N-acetyltransferase n=1 Tax=Endozoicomonas sp. GU-1 TaxID=3009078 RepID=UPI0022B4E07B|nr:GNAT family N-acetyltransferase [Endozoicomonas sp. GU-1]WBA83149.1 GNAT family N-acetyltransferase [Endozoicomonas sp. GU-1]WBA86074.1 GNAT family N-acetyltransferase [Endozoicomonas sp. GU-1]
MDSSMTFPSGNPYRGSIELSIDPASYDDPGKEKQGLVVHIYTDDLHLRSVEISDLNDLIGLYKCAENMKNYGAGRPWEKSISERLVQRWSDDWKKGNPFSGFSIFKRDVSGVQDPEGFIGNICFKSGENNNAYVGSTVAAGSSEMTFMIDHKCWGEGYGKQAAAAMVNGVAPEYQKQGFKVACALPDDTQESLPLEWLTATVSPENIGSVKILTGLGFEFEGTVEKQFVKGKSIKHFYAKPLPKPL